MKKKKTVLGLEGSNFNETVLAQELEKYGLFGAALRGRLNEIGDLPRQTPENMPRAFDGSKNGEVVPCEHTPSWHGLLRLKISSPAIIKKAEKFLGSEHREPVQKFYDIRLTVNHSADYTVIIELGRSWFGPKFAAAA